MNRNCGRSAPARHLSVVSSDQQAAEEPDDDRFGVTITFAGRGAVDLFRHLLGEGGSAVPDVVAAVTSAINALEEKAGGPLDLGFSLGRISSGHPTFTVGLAAPRDDPPDPPPRCG
jgi:hypothetical protein